MKPSILLLCVFLFPVLACFAAGFAFMLLVDPNFMCLVFLFICIALLLFINQFVLSRLPK